MTKYLVLAVMLSGCTVLKQVQANEAAKQLQLSVNQACAAKDAAALADLLKKTGGATFDQVRGCYIGAKTEALLALPCDGFRAAFVPIVTSDGRSTKTTPNPATAYGNWTSGLPPAERDRIVLSVAERAVACDAGEVLFTRALHRIDQGDRNWARVYRALEERNLDLYRPFVRFVGASVRMNDAGTVLSWLASRPARDCAELEGASAAAAEPAVRESTRAVLLLFFAKKSCRKEVTAVARELVSSRVATFRARSCTALRDVGETSLRAQMQLLAGTDPARQLETQDVGGYEYAQRVAYLTHPVREACQQAINELALKR